jgi:Holliday junction DNA helicase RuvA
MIARLRGRLLDKDPTGLVVEAGGVGYQVLVPLSTYARITADEVDLHIHTEVRADAILLFGFQSKLERELFRRLIAVQGVGPMTALAVLSGLSTEELVAAIQASDVKRLQGIPRIGKKTAERICLELREKMTGLETTSVLPGEPETLPTDLADAVAALEGLGYRTQQAREALLKARQAAPDGPIEAWVRLALKGLAP